MFKNLAFKINDKGYLKDFILKYKKWIIFIVILDLLGSSFIYFLPLSIEYVIDSIVLDNKPWLFSDLVNNIIIIAIISGITRYLASFYKIYLSGKLFIERTKLYLPKAINAKEVYGIGEITNALTDMLKSTDSVISSTVPTLIKDILHIILIVATLWVMNVKLTVLVFVPAAVIFAFSYFTTKKIRSLSRDQLNIFSNIFSIIKSIFGNINFVNVFSLDNFFLGLYENILDDYLKKQTEIAHLVARQMVISLLFFAVPSLILIVYGVQLIFSGEVTLGVVTMFVSYLISFSQVLTDCVNQILYFQQNVPAINKLEEIYNAPVKEWGDKELKFTNGDIDIRNVHFEYDRVIFEDMSCHFKRGINILKGPNGSGKTTLLNMLTKVIDLPDGKIFYDGLDINDVTESSLRENVGFVMANPFIFDSTFKDNICLGTDYGDEELMDVIKKVKLDGLLNKLPDGLDTMLTGDIVNLSSGEQQKISLARVILRNPNFILLDEVGSNIDHESLMSIYECLFSFGNDKTVILIDHSLLELNDDWNIVDLGNL